MNTPAGRFEQDPYGGDDPSAGQFEDDAEKDKLPTVSWIIPTSTDCEHPDYMPAAGADFVAGKVNALAANKDVWAKTLLIVNYDENDGLFDHVRPPTGKPSAFCRVKLNWPKKRSRSTPCPPSPARSRSSRAAPRSDPGGAPSQPVRP